MAPKVISFTIEDIAGVTYNGTAHTPAVVVKDGTTFLSGSDYSATGLHPGNMPQEQRLQ